MIHDPSNTCNCPLWLIRLCGIKGLNLEATPYAVVILKLDPYVGILYDIRIFIPNTMQYHMLV